MLSSNSKSLLFFHRENLSPKIFPKALQNFKMEVNQQQKESETEFMATTWKQWFREMSAVVVAFLKKNRGPPPIPRLLGDGRKSGRLERLEECEDRTLYALREPTALSLIERNSHIIHMLCIQSSTFMLENGPG